MYVQYRGHSWCRLCDNNRNGTKSFVDVDLDLDKDFSNYIWPDGFKHYIQQHNIKPNDGFINFINNIELKNIGC